jgi:hypothetical protein
VVLALASGVLVGCGSQEPASTPSSTAAAATSAEKSMTGTAPADPADSETTEPEAITELVSFTAPNGNVGCMLDSTYVRCHFRT